MNMKRTLSVEHNFSDHDGQVFILAKYENTAKILYATAFNNQNHELIEVENSKLLLDD